MPRPKSTVTAKPVNVQADSPALLEAAEAFNVVAAVKADYNEERDLLNQLLGQAQMAGAFEEFSRTVRTSKLAYVKENKLYRVLAGRKNPNGSEYSGSWEEFCVLLGMSVDKADLDISNLRAFGEEALESMSRMGIGYRELRQFRRLPDDQKAALIEVAKAGDKDSFLELAEDLIAKHVKEKEVLSGRIEEAEADLEARSRILDDKNNKIDQLTEEMTKIKKRVKALSPADVGGEIRREMTSLANKAEIEIRAMRAGLLALAEHTEASGTDHGDFSAGLICQIELVLRQLRGEFNIKSQPDGDDTPEWLRPGADDPGSLIPGAPH